MAVSRETGADTFHLPPSCLKRLDDLARWLATAAHPLGLTGYPDATANLEHGVLPALVLHELLAGGPIGPWLEIGPGSGALGLALSLCSPAAHFSLCDRREKVAAFLDLTIARFGIPNARAIRAHLATDGPSGGFLGVVFRALDSPTHSLSLAAHHARRLVCAWHAPGIGEYAHAPPGFARVKVIPTRSPNLVASLYQRL